MSITGVVLAQSPEPQALDKVFDNNPDRNVVWKTGVSGIGIGVIGVGQRHL